MTRSPAPGLLCVALLALAGCGGNAGIAPVITGGGNNPLPPPVSPVQHIVVVVEENHSYESVIGNPDMPYLNDLANRYALATSYYANTHPSIGNYFMLTTGAVITNDDYFSGSVSSDNIARELKATGKSWYVYAESLPSIGYLGGDQGAYVKHHNPFAYFSDVVNDISQAQNIVPFPQFSADLSRGTLPNFALVIPNNNDNAHDGTLAAADSWLRTNIDPLVNDADFQKNGLLLIVFDEGYAIDIQHGGGRVAAVLVGGRVKQGFRSSTFFQHQNALHFFLEQLGVARMPGAATGALSMNDMLQ
jgi:acid phosphatase